MGNALERVQGQAKTNAGMEAAKRSDDYLDEDEQRHLWISFQKLFGGVASTNVNDSIKAKIDMKEFTPNRDKFIDRLSRGYHNFLAELMYDYVTKKKIFTYGSFETLVIDCTRISSSRSLEMMWELARHAAISHKHLDNISQLHRFCYLALMFSLGGQPLTDQQALEESSRIADFYVATNYRLRGVETHDLDFDVVSAITNSYLPHAAKAFQTYFCILLLKSYESPSYVPFRCVEVMGDSDVVTPFDLALFGMHSDEMQGAWKRLYSSAVDGLSFNRFEHHILGYDGPTCILIKCNNAEKTRFGVYTSTRWKETNRFYGSSKCLLFTIFPKLRIFRPKADGNGNYMWLNSKSYALPHGLGMGGTLPGQGGELEGFRFFIPDSLENCVANNTCPTFEPGPLVPSQKFEIDVLEVWACGGVERVERGLRAQKQNRQLAQENIDKARKVDKAAFFNNAFDQEFLLSNTFTHKQFQTEEDSRAFEKEK